MSGSQRSTVSVCHDVGLFGIQSGAEDVSNTSTLTSRTTKHWVPRQHLYLVCCQPPDAKVLSVPCSRNPAPIIANEGLDVLAVRQHAATVCGVKLVKASIACSFVVIPTSSHQSSIAQYYKSIATFTSRSQVFSAHPESLIKNKIRHHNISTHGNHLPPTPQTARPHHLTITLHPCNHKPRRAHRGAPTTAQKTRPKRQKIRRQQTRPRNRRRKHQLRHRRRTRLH